MAQAFGKITADTEDWPARSAGRQRIPVDPGILKMTQASYDNDGAAFRTLCENVKAAQKLAGQVAKARDELNLVARVNKIIEEQEDGTALLRLKVVPRKASDPVELEDTEASE